MSYLVGVIVALIIIAIAEIAGAYIRGGRRK